MLACRAASADGNLRTLVLSVEDRVGQWELQSHLFDLTNDSPASAMRTHVDKLSYMLALVIRLITAADANFSCQCILRCQSDKPNDFAVDVCMSYKMCCTKKIVSSACTWLWNYRISAKS